MSSYEQQRLAVDSVTADRCRTFSDRIRCWEDTCRQAATMPTPPSVKVRFQPAQPKPKPSRKATAVSVESVDSIDCGLSLLARGHFPVVLNLADDCMPGGCVDLGSGAQEESLFRRTALCQTLRQEMYPIRDDEGIYSPSVTVLKASEAAGWAQLPDLPKLAFMTVPGVKYPHVRYEGDVARLQDDDVNRLETKVRTMLQIAAAAGHDAVVLGASGCGAWRCPPQHVAEVFARIVAEYDGVFELVTFAVLKGAGDCCSREANHDVFKRAFARHSPLPGPCALDHFSNKS